jgi:TP901 family phage tail tape measure protein
MAAFNLTAEINLRGPSNLNRVVADIRRQLSTVSLNLNISPTATRGIQGAVSQVQALNNVLQSATANANTLNAALANLGTSIGNAANGMNNLGTGLNNVNNQIGNVRRNTADAAFSMEEFGRQSAIAVRRFAAFSVPTAAIYGMVRAITSAYQEFITFNKELVRLQQVTGATANGLKAVTDEITRLSTNFGVASSELLTVSSTLAQAGLTATQTKTALEALAKSALAPSFDNLNDTVEGSIALMRQFGLSANDLEGALGSINAVAAQFAVESSDIITAIQRTGGVFAAASKGVSQGKDALNEFIAVFTSVRATTRESAETIATGLRTIFTRIQRGGTIQALKEYGIELTDLEDKFVGPYEAVRRLADGLRQLDPRDLRFSQIVEELGGFRQIGKVIPLIQQFTTAQQALATAQKGAGSLAIDAAIAQQSLANKILKVREEFVALIRDIGQSKSFQTFADISLKLASALISVASAAKEVFPALAALATIRAIPAIASFVGGFGRGFTRRNAGGPIRKFATGGYVPGSGNRDTVPAMLTPGEFVIRKKAVEKIGVGKLSALNRNKGGPVGLQYFNNGGLVQKFATGKFVQSSIRQLKTIPGGSRIPKNKNITDIDEVGGRIIPTAIRFGQNEFENIFQNMKQVNKYTKSLLTKSSEDPKIQRKIYRARGSGNLPRSIPEDITEQSQLNNQVKGLAFEKLLKQKYPSLKPRGGGSGIDNILYAPLDFAEGDAKFVKATDFYRNPSGQLTILSKRLRNDPNAVSPPWSPDKDNVRLLKDTKVFLPIKGIKEKFDKWYITRLQRYQATGKNFGGYIQKLMAGSYVEEPVAPIKLPSLTEMLSGPYSARNKEQMEEWRKKLKTIFDEYAIPFNEVTGQATIGDKKINAKDLLDKNNPLYRSGAYSTSLQNIRTSIEDSYSAIKRGAGPSSTNEQNNARKNKLLFGAVGLYGNRFPAKPLLLNQTDGLKAPTSTIVFGATLATKKEKQNRLAQRKALFTGAGKPDPDIAGIKASPTVEKYQSEFRKRYSNVAAMNRSSKQQAFAEVQGIADTLSSGNGSRIFLDFDKTLAFGADKIKTPEMTGKPGMKDFSGFGDKRQVKNALRNARLSQLGIRIKKLVDTMNAKNGTGEELLKRMFVVSARPDRPMRLVSTWLRSQGLKIPSSNFSGVGGIGENAASINIGLSKAEKMAQIGVTPGSVYIDDDPANISAAYNKGIKGQSYGYKPSAKELEEDAVSEGYFFQGKINTALPPALQGAIDRNKRGIDFPNGLTPNIANDWFNDSRLVGIPVDAKRTLAGPSDLRDNIASYLKSNGYASGGLVQKFADGGSPEDTVPALLTPGEFVINKRAAKRIGSAKLHQLNKADKISGFNSGGAVGHVQSFAGGGGVQRFIVGGIVQAIGSLVKSLPQLASAVVTSVNRFRGVPRNVPAGGGWTRRGGTAMPFPGNENNNNGMGTTALMFIGPMIAESINSAISKRFGATGAAVGSIATSGISGATIGAAAGPWGALVGAATGLIAGFMGASEAANEYTKAQNDALIESESSKLEKALDNLSKKTNLTAADMSGLNDSINRIIALSGQNRELMTRNAAGMVGQGGATGAFGGFVRDFFGSTMDWWTSTLTGQAPQAVDRNKLSTDLLSSYQPEINGLTRSIQESLDKGFTFEEMSKSLNLDSKEKRRTLAVAQGGRELTDLEAKRADILFKRYEDSFEIDPTGKRVNIGGEDQRKRDLAAIDAEIERKERELAAARVENIKKTNEAAQAIKVISIELDLFSQTIKKFEGAISRADAEFEEATRQRAIATGPGLGDTRIVGPSRIEENMFSNLGAYSMEEVAGAIDRLSTSLNFSPEFTQRAKTDVLAQQTLESKLPEILLKAAQTTKEGAIDDTAKEEIKKVFDQIKEAFGVEIDQTALDKGITSILEQLGKKTASLQGKSYAEIAQAVPELADLMKFLSGTTEAVAKAQKSYNDMLSATIGELNDYTNHLSKIMDMQIQAATIQLEASNNLNEALGRPVTVAERNRPFEDAIRTLTTTDGPNGLAGTLDPAEIARRLAQANQNLQNEQKKQPGQGADQEAIDDWTDKVSNAKVTVDKLTKAQEKLANDTTRASNALSRIRDLRQAQESRRGTFNDVLQNINNPQWMGDFIDEVNALTRVQAGVGSFNDIPKAMNALERRLAGMDPNQRQDEQDKFYNNIAKILQNAGASPELLDNIKGLIGVGGPDAAMREAIDLYNKAIKDQVDATNSLSDTMKGSSQLFYDKIVEAAEAFLDRVSKGAAPPDKPKVPINNAPAGVAGGKATGGLIYASQGKYVNFQPKGTDTVPAMLTPGEFVINKKATAENLPLLQSINNGNYSGGGKVKYLAEGGMTGPAIKGRRTVINGKEYYDKLNSTIDNYLIQESFRTFAGSKPDWLDYLNNATNVGSQGKTFFGNPLWKTIGKIQNWVNTQSEPSSDTTDASLKPLKQLTKDFLANYRYLDMGSPKQTLDYQDFGYRMGLSKELLGLVDPALAGQRGNFNDKFDRRVSTAKARYIVSNQTKDLETIRDSLLSTKGVDNRIFGLNNLIKARSLKTGGPKRIIRDNQIKWIEASAEEMNRLYEEAPNANRSQIYPSDSTTNPIAGAQGRPELSQQELDEFRRIEMVYQNIPMGTVDLFKSLDTQRDFLKYTVLGLPENFGPISALSPAVSSILEFFNNSKDMLLNYNEFSKHPALIDKNDNFKDRVYRELLRMPTTLPKKKNIQLFGGEGGDINWEHLLDIVQFTKFRDAFDSVSFKEARQNQGVPREDLGDAFDIAAGISMSTLKTQFENEGQENEKAKINNNISKYKGLDYSSYLKMKTGIAASSKFFGPDTGPNWKITEGPRVRGGGLTYGLDEGLWGSIRGDREGYDGLKYYKKLLTGETTEKNNTDSADTYQRFTTITKDETGNYTGFKNILAKFIELKTDKFNRESVTLEEENGNRTTLPITDFSRESASLVRSLAYSNDISKLAEQNRNENSVNPSDKWYGKTLPNFPDILTKKLKIKDSSQPYGTTNIEKGWNFAFNSWDKYIKLINDTYRNIMSPMNSYLKDVSKESNLKPPINNLLSDSPAKLIKSPTLDFTSTYLNKDVPIFDQKLAKENLDYLAGEDPKLRSRLERDMKIASMISTDLVYKNRDSDINDKDYYGTKNTSVSKMIEFMELNLGAIDALNKWESFGADSASQGIDPSFIDEFEFYPKNAALIYGGAIQVKKKKVEPVNKANGGIVYASSGTLVPYQPRGTDTIPAMLTPGEFVVNAKATKQNLGLLQSINNGTKGYSKGGVVYLQQGGMPTNKEKELQNKINAARNQQKQIKDQLIKDKSTFFYWALSNKGGKITNSWGPDYYKDGQLQNPRTDLPSAKAWFESDRKGRGNDGKVQNASGIYNLTHEYLANLKGRQSWDKLSANEQDKQIMSSIGEFENMFSALEKEGNNAGPSPLMWWQTVKFRAGEQNALAKYAAAQSTSDRLEQQIKQYEKEMKDIKTSSNQNVRKDPAKPQNVNPKPNNALPNAGQVNNVQAPANAAPPAVVNPNPLLIPTYYDELTYKEWLDLLIEDSARKIEQGKFGEAPGVLPPNKKRFVTPAFYYNKDAPLSPEQQQEKNEAEAQLEIWNKEYRDWRKNKEIEESYGTISDQDKAWLNDPKLWLKESNGVPQEEMDRIFAAIKRKPTYKARSTAYDTRYTGGLVGAPRTPMSPEELKTQKQEDAQIIKLASNVAKSIDSLNFAYDRYKSMLPPSGTEEDQRLNISLLQRTYMGAIEDVNALSASTNIFKRTPNQKFKTNLPDDWGFDTVGSINIGSAMGKLKDIRTKLLEMNGYPTPFDSSVIDQYFAARARVVEQNAPQQMNRDPKKPAGTVVANEPFSGKEIVAGMSDDERKSIRGMTGIETQYKSSVLYYQRKRGEYNANLNKAMKKQQYQNMMEQRRQAVLSPNRGRPQNFNTGGIVYASNGQYVNFQPRGTDTVPAMLTPGEFVVNRKATRNNLNLLKSINSNNYSTGGIVNPQYFADAGRVGGISASSSRSSNGVSVQLDTGSLDKDVNNFKSVIDNFSNTINQFVGGGNEIASALAGFSNVANAFTALSSVSKLLGGTAGQLGGAIGEFNSMMTKFNEALKSVSIPDNIDLNVTGSIPVNVTVTVNGGNGLDDKLSSFEDAIYNEIASEVARATAGRNQIKLNFKTTRK